MSNVLLLLAAASSWHKALRIWAAVGRHYLAPTASSALIVQLVPLAEDSWGDQWRLCNFSSLNIEVDLWVLCDCHRYWSILSALAEGVRLANTCLHYSDGLEPHFSPWCSDHCCFSWFGLASGKCWGSTAMSQVEERWTTLRFHRWADDEGNEQLHAVIEE